MVDFITSEDHLLLKFPPRLRKNMNELWTNGKVGISSKNMKVHLNTNKYSVEYSTAYADSFKLEIPYAGKLLHWEVFFKEEDYNYPPDFNFPNDPFLSDPDVNIISTYIPSLAKWDANNPKCFVSVVKELLTLYKKFQVMRLETENKFNRLYSEYTNLASESDDGEDNIEVFIENSGIVHFFVGITIDFSCLPPYVQPILAGKADKILNPSEDTATLRVSFVKLDGSKVLCELQMSPRLEQVIGRSTALHIPAFQKDDSLFDYITKLTAILEERVQQVANHYKLKNEYISSILSSCGDSIVEYDNTMFSKAAFICELNNFHVLVLIQIGDKFPNEPPKVILRSVYVLQPEKPFEKLLSNCPYSPRWNPEEMIKRLKLHVLQEIPNFQAICQKLTQS